MSPGPSLTIRVHGDPASKGSFMAVMPKGHKRPVALPMMSQALKAWEKCVRDTAQAECVLRNWRMLEAGVPVKVVISLFYGRPKHHFRTGRFANVLREDSPDGWHIQSPDIDKAVRATLDPLTGVVFADDKQVCVLMATATWCMPGTCGALIRVTLATEDDLLRACIDSLEGCSPS